MLCYCNKCGRIVSCDNLDEQCDYCHSITYHVPDEFLGGKSKVFIKKELEQQFIEEFIKLSSEFDQYLFDHRDEDLFKRRMENRAKLEHGKAILESRDKGNKFGVECPYCHATNVKKITNTSKAVHTAIFGLFSVSRNNGTQWHCNKCGSDF